jgi:4-hydroxyphenylpyruvate dioxygenase
MKPALSQICSLNSSFQSDIEDYAAGKCHAIEVWLTKLEAYLQSHSHDELARLLSDHEMSLPVASLQGGLLTSQGAKRDEAWRLLAERLRLCRQAGISLLVVVADIDAPLTQLDVDRAQVSLQKLAEEASRAETRIALEFQARSAFCNNLQTAVALVSEVASPYIGLCLDAFHFYVGPSKTEDLVHLTRDNLFHVQLCDLADVARELATDADRILPGEGDIPLQPIIDHLRQINYDSYVSIEIMNPHIWRIPPLQFGEIGMTSVRRVLGLASMGG